MNCNTTFSLYNLWHEISIRQKATTKWISDINKYVIYIELPKKKKNHQFENTIKSNYIKNKIKKIAS